MKIELPKSDVWIGNGRKLNIGAGYSYSFDDRQVAIRKSRFCVIGGSGSSEASATMYENTLR